MQKNFKMFILTALIAFVFSLPTTHSLAAAEFDQSTMPLMQAPDDTDWLCYGSPVGCPDPNDPMSPYIDQGLAVGIGFSALADAVEDLSGKKIYYMVDVEISWSTMEVYGPVLTEESVGVYSANYSDGDTTGWVSCGTGFSGSCTITLTGELEPGGEWSWDAGVFINLQTSNPTYFISHEYNYYIYFSLYPFDGGCEQQYIQLTYDGPFEIDPTIETPQGTVGDPVPVDEQIYPMMVDEVYRIELEGGPWNDGTDDRTDVAISWDGTTWTQLENVPAECVTQSADGTVQVAYVVAESQTFHIRVNDTAGNFADNIVDPEDPPFTYSVGLTAVQSSPPCESQFTYDEMDDWVASVTVHGDDADGVLATELLETGEWYAIAVASGSWQDEGDPPDLYSLDYYNGPSEYAFSSVPYIDLSGGSGTAWCSSEDGKVSYIQAKDIGLWLRVNDPTNEYENNTGVLGINIFHATFTRTPETCEMQFRKESLIGSGSVDGKFENGMTFIMSAPSALDQTGLATPGAWYYLETTGGPWQWKGATHSPYAIAYDMAVGGIDWRPLDEWEESECVIQLDGLGHQGAYFQIPTDMSVEWRLRVNDSEAWSNNSGVMGWNLYGSTDLGIVPSDNCDFIYDQDHPTSGDWVDANAEEGEWMQIYSGNIYALVIEDDYAWKEQDGGDNRFDVEISNDDGETWGDLPEGFGGTLCYTELGGITTVFIQSGQGQVWKLRVNSTTFEDNLGGVQYKLYMANAGDVVDPWTSCFDGNVIYELNSGTSIPPKQEEGIYINGTNILTGGDEIQLLQPTETYKLQIEEGPWYNGEGLDSFDADISADNGVTWYAIDDRENPNIICGDTDFTGMHKSVYFTVLEDQKWKIRVGDEAGAFTDNGGDLWYKLYSVSGEDVPAVDVTTVPMSVVNNVCTAPLIRPTSILEVSRWVEYARLGVQKYFAWCPEHTNIVVSLINALKTREPFATVAELNNDVRQIKYEVDAYGWGEAEDTSLFSVSSGQDLETKIVARLLPVNGLAWDMWSGDADIVDMSDSSMPDEYTSCRSSFAGFLPTSLLDGMCFVFGYFKSTGASFFIQLAFDVAVIFALFGIFKEALADTIYMVTGTKPWQGVRATIPGIQRAWGDVSKGRHGDAESLGPTDGDILSQTFGGKWDQGADGGWKKRR